MIWKKKYISTLVPELWVRHIFLFRKYNQNIDATDICQLHHCPSKLRSINLMQSLLAMVKILCHYHFRDNNTYLCAITVYSLISLAHRGRHKDKADQSLHFMTV